MVCQSTAQKKKNLHEEKGKFEFGQQSRPKRQSGEVREAQYKVGGGGKCRHVRVEADHRLANHGPLQPTIPPLVGDLYVPKISLATTFDRFQRDQRNSSATAYAVRHRLSDVTLFSDRCLFLTSFCCTQ